MGFFKKKKKVEETASKQQSMGQQDISGGKYACFQDWWNESDIRITAIQTDFQELSTDPHTLWQA